MDTMDGEHMRNLINCGTCGYPLTPEERATLVEQDGVMVKPAPVVPDVMTTTEGEHPEYVQGWNDCRQLMLQTRNNRHD
jgi:hypothetical protein